MRGICNFVWGIKYIMVLSHIVWGNLYYLVLLYIFSLIWKY